MISELTGMDLANASMYDGSTAAAEAVMMAVRVTGKNSAVVARSLHPEYREVLTTYAAHQEIPLKTVAYTDSGQIDLKELEKANRRRYRVRPHSVAEFLWHHRRRRSHRRHRAQAGSTADRLDRRSRFRSGIVEPPRTADIVAMEAQSFGVPLGFGGPYCGVLATKDKFW